MEMYLPDHRENCVEIRDNESGYSYKWKISGCDFELRQFICEKSMPQ